MVVDWKTQVFDALQTDADLFVSYCLHAENFRFIDKFLDSKICLSTISYLNNVWRWTI